MRRLFAPATLVALLLVTSPAAPAHSDERLGVAPRPLPVPSTGVTLDGELWVPPGVDAASPAPVVVVTHGFGGNKRSQHDTIALLLDAGYVVYAYTARGFGATGGQITLGSVHFDVPDVVAIIDTLAAQPEILVDGPQDPRLGMIGPSYGGAVQLQVAAVDPRVDAIVPMITWNSLRSSLAPDGVLKERWASFFLESQDGQGGCGAFPDVLCDAYRLLRDGEPLPADAAALLEAASPAPRLDAVNAPTLLVQGQADTLFPLGEAIATYEVLAANGTPVNMIWIAGGHGHPGVEGEAAVVNEHVLTWFARYLRDDANADVGAAFVYYRNWVPGPLPRRYAVAPGYPLADATHLALSSDGRLVSGGEATTGDVRVDAASASAAQGDAGPRFITAPLEAPLEIVGASRLRFRARADHAGAVLFASLHAVAPDGGRTPVGPLAAPVRLEDPVQPVDVALAAAAHRIPAGHRLELTVTRFAPQFSEPATPAPVTLTLDEESTLSLPVLEAPAALEAAADVAAAPDASAPVAGDGALRRLLIAVSALLVAAAVGLLLARRGH